MNVFIALRLGITRGLRIFTTSILITGLFASHAYSAQTDGTDGTQKPSSEKSKAATEQMSPEEAHRREAWRDFMRVTPKPKKGCFTATYPKTEWQEVPCITPPDIPMPPRQGVRPLVVGNGDDISAQVPTTGFISTAIGSFDSVTGVTSESSPIGNSGPSVANAYTLQINTDFFASTACAGSPNTGCRGWEQFVHANDGSSGSVFIQYWLIRYNTTCPMGWTQFMFTGSTDIYCYRNSPGATAVPNQPITNLGQLSLAGSVSATSDSATLTTGTNAYSVAGSNSVNAAAGWQTAEFNVFGYGGNSSGGGAATFNSGSTIVPRTRIFYGSPNPPTCVASDFTGETNNLSFGPTAPVATAPGPAVNFTESSAGGATSNCAAATTVGDTHLATFKGLFYDFQASGDFILAQVDKDFVVQSRQVSGAPTWPNASVNSAVATQMGNTKVALCLAPPGDEVSARLHVDGKPTDLGDGKYISTPKGVDIWRTGNLYVVTDQTGNSVRATVNPTWINVSVGLGRWPVTVHGLLANANDNVYQIATRDGAVLTSPFAFEDLYYRYADSWRVPAKTSLLSPCGLKDIERSAPEITFYANDLDPTLAEKTRAVCTAAGVKPGPLLEACILDVAVIGNDLAAKVFVDARAPVAVGRILASASQADKSRQIVWWLVLIIIVLILLLIVCLRKKATP